MSRDGAHGGPARERVCFGTPPAKVEGPHEVSRARNRDADVCRCRRYLQALATCCNFRAAVKRLLVGVVEFNCGVPGCRPMTGIESLVEDFTAQLAALIERATLERARQAVESALGVASRGRTSKASLIVLGANQEGSYRSSSVRCSAVQTPPRRF